MSSLQASKLFVITENQERADAILKGGAEDWYSPNRAVLRRV